MGDLKTLGKARMELEELYLGIPDDSVNLTFQDLANVKPNASEKKKSSSPTMEPIQEPPRSPKLPPPPSRAHLKRFPSLDFNTGLEVSRNDHHHHHHNHDHAGHDFHHDVASHGHNRYGHDNHEDQQSHHGSRAGARGNNSHVAEFRHAIESSRAYDDASVMSMNSMYQERGGRHRRPGIPHSNICTICSTYIYIFRHRCLVCGRVYCRNCMSIGMGDMTEGRKCVECLGRKFSQRYIGKAGEVGCCCSMYPRAVREAELKWAEKGPRRPGERAYDQSTMMMSRLRSPAIPTPRTPSRAATPHSFNSPNSFVTSSHYSPYSPSHHHLPL